MPASTPVHYNEVTLADFATFSLRHMRDEEGGLLQFLEAGKENGYWLYGRVLLSSNQNRVLVWDEEQKRPREMIMMGSNNYLGLNHHPKVIEAGMKALKKYGTGCCGSALLCGTLDLHRELEQKLAEFKGTEAALVWPSGFSTNVGCIPSLTNAGADIFLDKLCHASLIDGAFLSKNCVRFFRHNSIESLGHLLAKSNSKGAGKLVVVEGVYSMDGDIAPLPEIKTLAQAYGARILLDDAHGTGVLGTNGRGTAEYFGLDGQVDITMGTFSKSLGGVGGFVASSREVIEHLRYFARSYVFSASPAPAVVASIIAALEVIEKEPEIRERLWKNIHYMKESLSFLGLDTGESNSAVLPIIIGDEQKLRQMTRHIDRNGIFLNAVIYPAVPRNACRFRLTVTADHTQEDLDQTLEVLETAGKASGLL